MSLEIEELSTVEKKLSFVVSAKKVDAALEDAYRLLGTQVTINGFRKGKVPRRILERRYAHHIEGEVGGQVISDAFDEAIEEPLEVQTGPSGYHHGPPGGDLRPERILEQW